MPWVFQNRHAGNLDLTPVERVARMLGKGYLYGSHFLPHDALATQKSGRTFLSELNEAGLVNLKAVPRTDDVWVGINRLRQMLPRFSFRVPNVSEAWRLSAIIAPCAKQALAWPETSPSMIFRAMHVTHSAWLPRQTWHTC